jgi:hypothetical protein
MLAVVVAVLQLLHLAKTHMAVLVVLEVVDLAVAQFKDNLAQLEQQILAVAVAEVMVDHLQELLALVVDLVLLLFVTRCLNKELGKLTWHILQKSLII